MAAITATSTTKRKTLGRTFAGLFISHSYYENLMNKVLEKGFGR